MQQGKQFKLTFGHLPLKGRGLNHDTICLIFINITLSNSPLQDAALRTNMSRPPGVAVEKKDRDTPSEGDYMGGKLKT